MHFLEYKINNDELNFEVKFLNEEYREEFNTYLMKNFTFYPMSPCIDWRKVKNSKCIEIDKYSFEEISKLLLNTHLKNFTHLCFAYFTDEKSVICKRKEALENIHDLLPNYGDAYVYGATKDENSYKFFYDFFVEFCAGNWMCSPPKKANLH